MEVKWSPSALLRLETIGDFIAKDAPPRAADFEDRLLDSVQRLKEFPFSGSLAPENPAYRQVVLDGYRVIYAIKPAAVEIVTILSPGLDGERVFQIELAKKQGKKKR